MKTISLIALTLLMCCSTFAKDKPPIPTGACVAVVPSPPMDNGCGIQKGLNVFLYLESVGLPMKEIKTCYAKRDLEKLEARGVQVVVTARQYTIGCQGR
jgi:hypothetical protein